MGAEAQLRLDERQFGLGLGRARRRQLLTGALANLGEALTVEVLSSPAVPGQVADELVAVELHEVRPGGMRPSPTPVVKSV